MNLINISSTVRLSLKEPVRSIAAVAVFAICNLYIGQAKAQDVCQFNFENEYDIQSNFRCSGNCPKITTEYAREGTSSLRSYVNREKSQIPYRTELNLKGGSDGPQKMIYGEEYWFGFSTLFPLNWTHSGGTEIVAQIHSTGLGVPFAIRAGQGFWQVLSRGQRTPTSTYNLNSVYDDLGRWVDWVIRYKPSYESDGVLRVWKDGVRVVNQVGRATAHQQKIGPFWKMGMYLSWRDPDCCDGLPPGKKVYHDAFRIATGSGVKYRDVAPRNGTVDASDLVTDDDCALTN